MNEFSGLTAKQKNKEIEFLRFFFAVLIVLHHSKFLFTKTPSILPAGSLSVEFFFLLSGVLMMASVEKSLITERVLLNLCQSVKFIARKYKVFVVELILSEIIGVLFFIPRFITDGGGVRFVTGSFLNDVLLLRMTGFIDSELSVNGPTWYLSSMIICMLFIHILLYVKNKHIYRITMAVAVLIVGILLVFCRSLRDPTGVIAYVYKGNLRAFSELCIGTMIFYAIRKFKNMQLSRRKRVFLTICKYCLIVFIVFLMQKSTGLFDFICMFFIGTVILIVFSEQCIDSAIFNNRICEWLGAFSLPMFLCNSFVAKNLRLFCPVNISNAALLILYIVIVAILSFVVYVMASFIRSHVMR